MVWLAVLAIIAFTAFLFRLVNRVAPPVARLCATSPGLRSFERADDGWMSGTHRSLAIRFRVVEEQHDSDDHWEPPRLTIRVPLNRPHFVHLARRPPAPIPSRLRPTPLRIASIWQTPLPDAPSSDGPYRTARALPPAVVPARQWFVEGAPTHDVHSLLADPIVQAELSSFYGLDGHSMTLRDGVLVLSLIGADKGDAVFLTAGLDSAVRLAEVLGSRLPGSLTRAGRSELVEGDADRAETVLRAAYKFHVVLLAIAPALLAPALATGQLPAALVPCLLFDAIASFLALSAIKERRKCGRRDSAAATRLLHAVKASWVALAVVAASSLVSSGGRP
jgi:hypothetical protein